MGSCIAHRFGRATCTWLVVACLFGCEERDESRSSQEVASAAEVVSDSETTSDPAPDYTGFPAHGLVVRAQLVVRTEPQPEGEVLGWLRWGERIRAKSEPTARTSTCSSGWFEIHPRGFVCAGQGVELGEEPPQPEQPVGPARRDTPLPYDYFFVKERATPQFHVVPSRQQQRDAAAFATRYLDLLDRGRDRSAARLMAGDVRTAPKPNGVAMFLQRGFYVASNAVRVRSSRHFVRSTTAGFVQQSRLEQREGSDFRGVEINADRTMPVPFVLRDIRPRIRREKADGSLRFVRDLEADVIVRQEVAASWRARERHGDDWYHRFESDDWDGPRYARDWFVGMAEQIPPPFEVEADEPWVHVDISSQTLVLYRGETPTYATLVSTGVDDHGTPTGIFRIRRKLITDTMADLGADTEDSYRIQDVPWTQYFEGSFALHGAFWHTGFGVPKSHGCVNLAPADAQRVFQELWPQVPAGWHGVSAERRRYGFKASRVFITD